MQYKGFWISMVLAIVLYAVGIRWAYDPTAVFLPLALWVACFINAWWGSKIVGWAAFSIAFISWLTVLGAFAIGWRVDPHLRMWLFARALVMYGALCLAGLYPLKGARG